MNQDTFNKLKEEYTNLGEKILELRGFLQDETKLKELDALNKDLLISQLKAMEAYLGIVSIRLGINSSQEEVKAGE